MAAELAGTRIAGLFAPVIDLIELAGAILIIVLGTWALTAGELTIGGLLAFLAYLSQLYRPVRDLSRLGQSVFEATAGAERVIELLDTSPASSRRRTRARSIAPAGSSSSSGVGYATPARAPRARRREPARAARALRGGRRRQRRRQVHARQARPALRRPGRGVVRLDGHDVRDLTLRCLRENVALLLQDAPLFDGTVRDNVAYGRPQATDEEVAAALGAARRRPRRRAAGRARHAHGPARPSAVRRPAPARGHGPRAAAGRAGARARRALGRPRRGGSRRLLGPLRRLMRDRATLLITHDLELAAAADEVVVLEAGRVVQRGAPAALELPGGPWARLRGSSSRRSERPHDVVGARLAPGLTVIEHLSRTRRWTPTRCGRGAGVLVRGQDAPARPARRRAGAGGAAPRGAPARRARPSAHRARLRAAGGARADGRDGDARRRDARAPRRPPPRRART